MEHQDTMPDNIEQLIKQAASFEEGAKALTNYFNRREDKFAENDGDVGEPDEQIKKDLAPIFRAIIDGDKEFEGNSRDRRHFSRRTAAQAEVYLRDQISGAETATEMFKKIRAFKSKMDLFPS